MRPGLLVALLAVGLLAAPVGAAPSAGSPFADPTTTYTFDLDETGDANVSVTVEYDLDSDNETEAFRDLAAEFERGATGPDVATFERAVDAASEATGRNMSLGDSNRTATVRNGSDGATGVLVLSFEWTNFATVEDDRIRVGDAYRTPDGTWLPGLRENQRLRVVGPAGYSYDDGGAANIEGGALVWEGPTTFDAGDLQVVLGGGDGSTPPTSPGDTDGPDGTDGGPGGDGPFAGALSPLFGGLLVAATVTAVGLYAFASRRDGVDLLGAAAPDGGESASADASGDDADSPAVGTAAPSAADTGDGTDGAAETASDPDAETGPFAGVDEDLLSDEERVERLLEYNGGRMRQADIVTETGWSNAKVSQLLSAMDEADRVDKLRIGRENLISLPGFDGGTGANGTGNNGGS